MKNAFGMVIVSGFILAFIYSSAAPAAGSPALESLRAKDSLAYRPGAGSESRPTLDNILQKYIKALGGKEALEKIRTRRLIGKLTHDFSGQNAAVTVLPAEVIAAAPDKWRLILQTSKSVQQMGFDGERSERCAGCLRPFSGRP